MFKTPNKSQPNGKIDSAIKVTTEIYQSYNNGVAETQKRVDKVPYERFPFCCSSDNTVRKEVNMARTKNIPPPIQQAPPVKKVIPVRTPSPPKPVIPATFWTPVVI